MSNLIERQAAIDAVCLNNYHDITLVNGKPYTRGYRDGVLAKENDCIENIMNLPSAEPEQRWIPCSERLPEQYGNYLVSIEGEEPDIGSINPNDPRGWSLCDANGFYWASNKMLNVTAWMPLPKPYGGDLDE